MYTLAVNRYQDCTDFKKTFRLKRGKLVDGFYYYKITSELYALLLMKYNIGVFGDYPCTKMGLCLIGDRLSFDYEEEYSRAIRML